MQAYIAGATLDCDNTWERHRSVLVFFAGCNFRCPYCYNSSILSFKEEFLTDTRSVKNEIMQQKVVSGIAGTTVDSVVFTGAEPTLQRQALLSIARFCRKLGLKIRLETNGTKPNSIKSLIREQLVDSICLDMKAPFEPVTFERATRSETFFKKTEEIINDVSETMKILKEHEEELELEIRTTLIPDIVYKKEHFLQIASLIRDAKCIWVLQKYDYERYPSEALNRIRLSVLDKYPEMRILIR